MTVYALILMAASVAAIGAIAVQYRGASQWSYLLKPLPVLLMIVVVSLSNTVNSVVGLVFVLGLVLSATGDALLIDRQRFLHGLLAFLFAHVAYILALWLLIEQPPRLWMIAPLSIWGGVLLWRLMPNIGKMAGPVLIYITVINVMIWLAIEAHAETGTSESRLLAVGALLFGVSDTILALDHFRAPFAGSKALISVTYYLAQGCLAFGIASVVMS